MGGMTIYHADLIRESADALGPILDRLHDLRDEQPHRWAVRDLTVAWTTAGAGIYLADRIPVALRRLLCDAALELAPAGWGARRLGDHGGVWLAAPVTVTRLGGA
jgi:hypothetical protein